MPVEWNGVRVEGLLVLTPVHYGPLLTGSFAAQIGAQLRCDVTDYREATVDGELHRVGQRLGFRFAAGSASSFSMRAGLAGTTTLPLFTLSRFWSCSRSPKGFPSEVRPFALKGSCSQPFSTSWKFHSP
jgi:hypothetical protein